MKGKRALRLALGAYYATMIYLLFLQRVEPELYGAGIYWDYVREHYNLVPFATVRELWGEAAAGTDSGALVNLLGNIVMFVPLGFFTPAIWEGARGFRRSMAICAGIIICVELVQLFCLLGHGDIDDLILNMLGAAAGYGLFAMWRRLAGR